ncbi:MULTISPECIES: hypothetical protein [Pseudomonas]|uniref:hypothetical protein n=1 Tax=Pseudomonas TaxID=286 RepID=UPI0002173622|nr:MULTISPECIES: hypothetical protein [Pseudomonas]AEJ13051.1 hypothetical protein PPS_2492 [Pseudomonas putida S16]WOB61343.1 hypothetical protein NY023_13105 [Pseudomonas sp. NBB]
MRYNTNNPAPSNDPRDLNDNTLILDELMNSLEETAKDRFERDRYTVQAFHNIVIDAKAQIDPTVEAAKEAVNSTADAAIEEMQETAASLGDDFNTLHKDTLAELQAVIPKYDGIVGIVGSDPDATKNGWYQWDAGTHSWVRLADQPAMSTTVEALRKQVSVKKRPRGKVSGDEPLIFGAAGAQMLFGVHKKVPRGPSKTKGTVPVLGKTPIPTLRSLLRPRSRAYPEPVVLVSGESVMLKTGGADTAVTPEVTYDAKLITEQSLPLAANRFALITDGQVWAYDPLGASQLTQAGTWIAAQAVAFGMVRAIKSSGSTFQPHTIMRDGRLFRDEKVLLHKLSTGQSLALGSRGIVPDPNGEFVIQGIRGNLVSPKAPAGYADKLWTLAGGPRPAAWEGTTAFEAVREYVAGVLGETPATSYMLAMRKWHERTSSVSPQMLYSVSALGGTAYAGIKKGTATYTNAISQVTTAKSIAESMGLDYVVPSISIVHGESQSSTTQAQYVAMQAEWIADYQADITAITGQVVPPIAFISQMLTGDPGTIPQIPLAQLQAHNENPSIVMVGPKYAYPYFDTYHMLAAGYVKMGELEARAERLTQVSGKWQPLKVMSAAVSGSKITLQLNNLPSGNSGTPGPIGKLALDTTIVSDPGNLGFQISAGTISTVSLGEDGVSIVITATAAIATGTVLTYALQPTLSSPQNGNGRRGCVRDTDLRDFSRYDMTPLYNWLCAFSIALEI